MTDKQSIHDTYEFLPDETITIAEVIELSQIIRIGIGGNTLEKATPELKRHFKKVA
jgi:hypothetical protein